MNFLTICFGLNFIAWFHEVNANSTCGYKPYQKKEKILSGQAIKSQLFQLSNAATTNQNLRIHIEYTAAFNALSDVAFYKKNVIEPAITILQSILKPKTPISDKLLVDRDCVDNEIVFVDGDRNKKGCVKGCSTDTRCTGIQVPAKFLKKCLSKSASGEYTASGEEGSSVANTDMVIVTTTQSCGAGTLATANSCFRELKLDRPILGAMEICNNNWKPRLNIQLNINTVIHEIIHALGFSTENFAFFRDSSGNPRTPRDSKGEPSLGYSSAGYFNFAESIAKTMTRTRKSALAGSYTKTVTAIVLPTALKYAREHFGCPTLDGIDLEESSNPNSVNSHWDKLFLGNEIMSPNSDHGEGVFSLITLGFLYDTGWYEVDTTRAQKFEYGSGKGCDFPLKGCFEYMQKQESNSQSVSPFCNNIPIGYELRCSSDRRFVTQCNMMKHTSLDPKFSYFKKLANLPSGDKVSHYGGSDSNNEYCPFPEKSTFGDHSSDCLIESNKQRNDEESVVWPEYYGLDSKCFDTTSRAWTVNGYTPAVYGARCFKYACEKSTGTLMIFQGSTKVCSTTSTAKEESFQTAPYDFHIKCPTYKDICGTHIPIFTPSSTTMPTKASMRNTFSGFTVFIWIIYRHICLLVKE